MRPLVVYHGGCCDGVTAAWIVSETSEKGVEFYAAKHGEPFTGDASDRHVVFVDFAYPPDEMRSIAETCATLLVLDHHQTTIEALGIPEFLWPTSAPGWPGHCRFFLNKSFSGAGLALQHFDPSNVLGVRAVVRRVEDRDLWHFRHADTASVFAAMTSYPLDPESWGDVMGKGLEALAAEGEAIERYRDQLVAHAVKRAEAGFIASALVPMTNCSYEVGSDAAAALLAEYPKAPFAAYWFDDGGLRQYGLRSRVEEDVDVAKIAEMYGGGGHTHASGFRDRWRNSKAAGGTLEALR